MRVFYDDAIASMVVKGTRAVYPPRSLRIEYDAEGKIEIWLQGEDIRLLGPIPWSRIKDQSGTPFGSLLDTVIYLNAENSKGPVETALEVVPDLQTIFLNRLLSLE